MHGLDRVDDHRHRLHRFSDGDDSFDRRLREQADVVVGRAEAAGADGDLARRFFAGDVEHDTEACELLRRLKQQCRLADARFAADECYRAGDEAAADDAVERGNVGGDAVRGVAVDCTDRDRHRARCRHYRRGLLLAV